MSARPDRRTLALVGAGLVLVVAAVVVATVGVVGYPSFPTVADRPQPTPPARVAFVSWGPDGSCARVVDPDGSIHDVLCDDDSVGGVQWHGHDLLGVTRYGPASEVTQILDPDTGDVRQVVTGDGPRPEPRQLPTDPHLTTSSEDGRSTLSVVEDGQRRTLIDVDGPQGYRLGVPITSPDGRFAAMVDSDDRLLLVSLEGDPAPRIWAEDARMGHDLQWEPLPSSS